MNTNKIRSLSNYRVFPLLMRVGKEETVTIVPIGEDLKFNDDIEYLIRIVPNDSYGNRLVCFEEKGWETHIHAYSQNGILTFKHTFNSEKKWTIGITTDEDYQKKKRPKEVYVYSLFEDLYERLPYMGDLHCHSTGSDGKDDPAILAANYRKEGFDFFALTDHWKMEPSRKMIKAYDGVKLGIKLFKGEEVHDPTGCIHIVNFGGQSSINEIIQNDPDAVAAEVRELSETLSVPDDVGLFEYSYRVWITRHIRSVGGLAITAHPCWRSGLSMMNSMSNSMYRYVMETGEFDALELVTGELSKENNLQSAIYYEEVAKGIKIPIVGSSDSHGTDPANLFGIGRTVVFAKDSEFDTLCTAIKDMYSVAIETQPGEEPRVLGSFRLVNYTHFLLDHYFPLHDELCVEEGILMREFILGNTHAGELLGELSDRVEKYARKILRNED